jgi:hypothetical protein
MGGLLKMRMTEAMWLLSLWISSEIRTERVRNESTSRPVRGKKGTSPRSGALSVDEPRMGW